ncbi:MAG: hypothetical protein AAGG02_13170 [Cyanobacteria bacterium P01_H01_bin.15]
MSENLKQIATRVPEDWVVLLSKLARSNSSTVAATIREAVAVHIGIQSTTTSSTEPPSEAPAAETALDLATVLQRLISLERRLTSLEAPVPSPVIEPPTEKVAPTAVEPEPVVTKAPSPKEKPIKIAKKPAKSADKKPAKSAEAPPIKKPKLLMKPKSRQGRTASPKTTPKVTKTVKAPSKAVKAPSKIKSVKKTIRAKVSKNVDRLNHSEAHEIARANGYKGSLSSFRSASTRPPQGGWERYGVSFVGGQRGPTARNWVSTQSKNNAKTAKTKSKAITKGQIFTHKQLADKEDINYSTFRSWVRQYRQGNAPSAELKKLMKRYELTEKGWRSLR